MTKAGIATCTAKGHPKPYLVRIYKHGKIMHTGELKASVKINGSICQSGITCYGENGKANATEPLEKCNTVNKIDLSLVFGSDNGIATCIAKGHPKPSSVKIYKDRTIMKIGKHRASVKINEDICQSNITCYAENGKMNVTEPMGKCNTGLSNSQPILTQAVLIATVAKAIILGSVATYLIYRYIHKKKSSELTRLQLQNISIKQ
ncbi:uncharacterized protein LOC117112638 [Anneissia japonica]|uniref:uncharacterized protein LOC117112638 n=1 Tax=Anneissia japonica TaxID=1529436 RepID=UPI001425747B|nr:uncharacterized protein LOC117112638 [Anneissia japonica]